MLIPLKNLDCADESVIGYSNHNIIFDLLTSIEPIFKNGTCKHSSRVIYFPFSLFAYTRLQK